MTTWILTPNTPDPMTRFENPVIGWHLTLATALDTLNGMMAAFSIGWAPHLAILVDSAPNAPIFQLLFVKGTQQVVVNDTDWFVTDGINIWAIPQATVVANYTVTQQS